MLTIFENDMPPEIRQTDCPVKRGNWIIGKAEEAGMMMPLIINRYYDGAIVVRGVKREQKNIPPLAPSPTPGRTLSLPS